MRIKSGWVNILLATVLMTVTVFAGGCGLTGGKDGDGDRSESPPVSPQPTGETVEITLFFSDDQAMYLKPEQRSADKGTGTMAELLVSELIKGPDTKGLHRTIPEEARLISLEVADGVAFVNFSAEMKTRHWGGSTGERMTVQSVVHTLAQLPEIEKVQFLIEGQKEEAIWGHGYTGEPIAPEQNIVN